MAFTLAVLGAPACSSASDAGVGVDEITGGNVERRFAAVGYLALEGGAVGAGAEPLCTATLVAPRVVVTAAHCVHDLKQQLRPGGPFLTFSRGGAPSSTLARVRVGMIFEHPRFDPPAYNADDLALLVLETPIENTSPARIVAPDWEAEHLAVGYGRTEASGQGTPTRRSLRMKLVGGTEAFYLAAPEGGAACYGDGGGPLVELERSQSGEASMAIAGVLATTFQRGAAASCAPGTRAMYTSLIANQAFIEEVIDIAEGREPPAVLVLPEARELPLTTRDLLRIGNVGAVDMVSSAVEQPDGGITVVFERMDEAATRGEMLIFRSPDGRRFTRPQPFGGGETFVGGPSAVQQGDATFLYYLTAPDVQVAPLIHRVRLEAGRPTGAAETFQLPGVDWVRSWPRFAPLGSGVGVAFRDGRSVPQFARSLDGTTFAPPRTAFPEGGAMVDFAELGEGTIALSFQIQTATEPFVSYVTLSTDGGTTWASPIRISPQSNVHDTSFARRKDGGLDLYYIYPPGDTWGFSLFRRSLSPAGALGLEQRLTGPDVREPSKPKALRRKDGRVLLSYAEITKRGVEGWPSVQQLVLGEIEGDAP